MPWWIVTYKATLGAQKSLNIYIRICYILASNVLEISLERILEKYGLEKILDEYQLSGILDEYQLSGISIKWNI